MLFSRALIWILVSTLLVSGSTLMGWLYFQRLKERRFHDDEYRIVAIIQSTTQFDSLKTVYLSELLNLSLDHPINLYQFNIHKAVHTLLNQPIIKEANVKKILPGTLYVHYEMREPIAYIGDYSNTAIDEEGVLFPFSPFFTPKHLPKIYLGLDKYSWGDCIRENKIVKLAFAVLKEFNRHQQMFYVKQIDVSQAKVDNYGDREIILMIDRFNDRETGDHYPLIYLRLNSEEYVQNLIKFLSLGKILLEKEDLKLSQEIIIDLRIPHLAFIEKNG